jgi:hypothetical protein
VGHVLHSGASRVRNVETLFFILGWDWYGFNKKRDGTLYVELVFLHPAGSAGHVVDSGASGQEMLTHYFSCSGGTDLDSTKCAPKYVTPNMCFCLW